MKNNPKELSDNFILQNIAKGKVCDLCCGRGNTIGLLENVAEELVGVDICSDYITFCNNKFNNNKITFIESSAINTGLNSKYFDSVIIRMGLHHIKEKKALLGEVRRLLKPKGKLIIIDKYYKNWLQYYFLEIGNLILRLDPRLLDHHIISKKANLSLFDKFDLLKKTYPVENKWTTQSFMLLLQKPDI